MSLNAATATGAVKKNIEYIVPNNGINTAACKEPAVCCEITAFSDM